MATVKTRSPWLTWPVIVPVVALVALAGSWGRELSAVVVTMVAIVLAAAVLATVHHAEVVAHWVGEPFGSLVLVLLAVFLFLSVNP